MWLWLVINELINTKCAFIWWESIFSVFWYVWPVQPGCGDFLFQLVFNRTVTLKEDPGKNWEGHSLATSSRTQTCHIGRDADSPHWQGCRFTTLAGMQTHHIGRDADSPHWQGHGLTRDADSPHWEGCRLTTLTGMQTHHTDRDADSPHWQGCGLTTLTGMRTDHTDRDADSPHWQGCGLTILTGMQTHHTDRNADLPHWQGHGLTTPAVFCHNVAIGHSHSPCWRDYRTSISNVMLSWISSFDQENQQ